MPAVAAADRIAGLAAAVDGGLGHSAGSGCPGQGWPERSGTRRPCSTRIKGKDEDGDGRRLGGIEERNGGRRERSERGQTGVGNSMNV